MTDGDTTLSAVGDYLEQHRGSLSKREAARRAGISEGRWRQIVTGQQKAGGGIVVPANPRRETVIAMAEAVGASVDEALRLAGMQPGTSTFSVSEPASTADMSAFDDAALSEPGGDVAAAIMRDQSLEDSARRHLLAQYEMLRELSVRRGSDRSAHPSPVPRVTPLPQPSRAAARRGRPDKS
jgi:hypothetical protein